MRIGLRQASLWAAAKPSTVNDHSDEALTTVGTSSPERAAAVTPRETSRSRIATTQRSAGTIAHALAFVAGFTSVFVGLGASASIIGQGLFAHKVLLMQLSGVVIIVLGLNMVGIFRIPLLSRDLRLRLTRPQASYPASFFAGIGFAAGWTPCIGPVLAAVLAMAGAANSIVRGTSLLLVYSLGLAVPFLALAIGLRYLMPLFVRMRRFVRIAEAFAGVLVIATGLILASGSFVRVLGWLYGHFPVLANVGTGPEVTSGLVTVGAAFIAGLVSCLSPCVFPLLPGYLSFLTGQSLESLDARPA